ncbi:hypothetical protein G5V59_26955 [Nocardioides sp. W3-2-3]|uniref:hypothetical protein n=1 Tax=Nocardioides convexus TaxID=2712224 RepID=UPI002418B7D6|nr:hypothetical protein [Nocardioides convexus]NHA02032.1 hypothetical protein [Nocardioides convexus]
MALDGMLDEIDETKIKGLLLRREDPMVFEETDVFEARVRGAAVEVVLLTGDDPDDLAIRALAVEAIAVQTASAIEYAEFPEQQAQGDTGRGYHLHQRYLGLLQRLQSLVDAGHGPDDGEGSPDDAGAGRQLSPGVPADLRPRGPGALPGAVVRLLIDVEVDAAAGLLSEIRERLDDPRELPGRPRRGPRGVRARRVREP